MAHKALLSISMLLVLLGTAACGAGAPSVAPSATPMTFDTYAVAFCSAWDSLFTAVGNPDTGSGSVLSKSLDDAVAAGDAATAERVAATMTTTLEVARQQAAVAARWPTAATMFHHFDRVVLAYEAMIAAKKAVGAQPQGNAQAAFEQAGGVDAWTAMLETYRTVDRPTGSSQANCPTVPIAP
jgi:hypothetical protein